MLKRKKYLHLLLILSIFFLVNIFTLAADSIILYTPLTGLYVSPGDSEF